jgi:hypothetical protein
MILKTELDPVPHGDQTKGFMYFGRYGASHHTGKVYGEIFAFHVTDIELLRHCVQAVRDLLVKKAIGRCNTWTLYRAMVGIPTITDQSGNILLNGFDFHVLKGNFIEIDDATEDFDCPEDYDRWIQSENKYM